jgi:hypothetical protein
MGICRKYTASNYPDSHYPKFLNRERLLLIYKKVEASIVSSNYPDSRYPIFLSYY